MKKKFEDFTRKQLETICNVSMNYASYIMANSTGRGDYCDYCPLRFQKISSLRKNNIEQILKGEDVCLKKLVKTTNDESVLEAIDEIEIDVNDQVFNKNSIGIICP